MTARQVQIAQHARNRSLCANVDNSRASWRYLHSILSIVLGVFTLTILLTGLTWSKYAGENFRAVYQQARKNAPDIQMQLTPPASASGVWRIDNYDRSQPDKRFQLVLDTYSGNTLFQSSWQQMPGLSRATAIGIPFHRGEFGWWYQTLLVLVGLSVIFFCGVRLCHVAATQHGWIIVSARTGAQTCSCYPMVDVPADVGIGYGPASAGA